MKKSLAFILSLLMLVAITPNAVAQSALPVGAEQVGEGFGYEAYTVETDMKTPDGDVQKELWFRDADGNTGRVLTTNLKFTPAKWDKARTQSLSSIMAISSVEFVKNRDDQKVYAVVQGCPDSRNIYMYIIQASMNPKSALFIPAAEGFVGYNDTDNTLNCMSYGYNPEDGRYSLLKVYDFKGKLLHTERMAADEEEVDGRASDEIEEASDCECGDGDDEEDGDCEMEAYVNQHELIDQNFGFSCEVKGGVGISQFVKVLPVFDDDFWRYCEPLVDQANGYFDWGEEGDGSIRYNAAYWNCKDGYKIFIISWRQGENFYFDKSKKEIFGTTHAENEWFKYEVVGIDDPENERDGMISCSAFDTGYRAYVYDAKAKEIQPLAKAPFNNMPKTKAHVFLEVPRKGKDIKVLETIYDKVGDPVVKEHTLKWNGNSFDYVK